MTLLNALTLATYETNDKLSPTLNRRRKLLAKIDEQIRYATDSNYQPTKQTWHKDSDGKEQRITVPKRVRRWWTVRSDGTVLLTVRYGSRALDLAKGKNAIVVNSVNELPTLLKRLSEAVDKGEFDTLLEAQASYGGHIKPEK